MNTAIAIHGGAGPDDAFIHQYQDDYEKALKRIVNKGHKMLRQGASSLAVVTETVKSLEDCPLFNAGRGAALNEQGQISMDASIMDGATKNAGAIAGSSTIRNPIMLAKAVIEHSDYVLLTGQGLSALNATMNLPEEHRDYFVTAHELQKFVNSRKEAIASGEFKNLSSAKHQSMHGTVGAVAVDRYGNMAAATSTGGAQYALPGRVSDSCIIGAGCFADHNCAVSCTGDGEFLIRGVIAHSVAMYVDLCKYSVQEACDNVIAQHLSSTYDMGFIAVDKNGNIGIAYNSERMHRAWIGSDGIINCAIYPLSFLKN